MKPSLALIVHLRLLLMLHTNFSLNICSQRVSRYLYIHFQIGYSIYFQTRFYANSYFYEYH